MFQIPTPLTPYMIWIKVAAVAAVLLLAGYSGYHLRDLSARSEIADVKLQAKNQVEAKQQEIDAMLLQIQTDKAKIEAKVRVQEEEHTKEIALISGQYQKRIKDLQDEKARTGISINTDGLWLDVDLTTCRKYNASPGPGTGIRDGATSRCRLSSQTTSALLAIVDDADEVASRLLGAQAVILEDRKINTR